MKRLPQLVVAAIIFTFPSSLPAQTGFREATWGMTATELLAAAPAKPNAIRLSNGERIVQFDSVHEGDWDGRVLYIFVKDKLVRWKYVLNRDHEELNDFIADFRTMDARLREKHGKPATERAIWEDDSTQLEPKSYLDQDRATPSSILPSDPLVGLAVSLGHLKLFTEWEDGRTRILHALTGADQQITHQIEYSSVQPQKAEPRP
jgi:hypothetical protein